MPTINESRNVSLAGYNKMQMSSSLPAHPVTPMPPEDLRPSSVLISSLPSIATNVDGVTRQFYGRGPVPARRLVFPQ